MPQRTGYQIPGRRKDQTIWKEGTGNSLETTIWRTQPCLLFSSSPCRFREDTLCDLSWGYRSKRKTPLKTMGEDDHEMVYGLPYEEQSDQWLLGVPCLRKWSDGVMECWNTGRIRRKIDSLLTHYSSTPLLKYFITPLFQLGVWWRSTGEIY